MKLANTFVRCLRRLGCSKGDKNVNSYPFLWFDSDRTEARCQDKRGIEVVIIKFQNVQAISKTSTPSCNFCGVYIVTPRCPLLSQLNFLPQKDKLADVSLFLYDSLLLA